MSFVRKVLVAGFAAGLALLNPIATGPSAHAQTLSAPLTAPITAPLVDPANAAAQYVLAQLTDETVGKSLGSGPSSTADAIVLLSSLGTYSETTELATWLETRESTITDPVQAAKVAVALHRASGDTAVIDRLAATTLAGMKENGSVGWPSAFTQAWPIIALAITGHDVPQEMLDNLFTHQGENGLFGYRSGGSWTNDADGTAMALFALLAVRANPGSLDVTVVDEQLPRIIAAAQGAQHESGYWTSFSPANSTGLMAMALHLAGEDVTDAIAWMTGQQVDDGGLPNILDGSRSNLMATLQGGIILGVTPGSDPEPTPPVEPEPTPDPQPTPDPSVAPEPTTEPTTSPSPTSPSVPAGTPTPWPSPSTAQPQPERAGKPVALPNTGTDR